MILIFCAAFCSIAVSILVKYFKTMGFNALQMVMWNYFAASVLCFVWFKPNILQAVAHPSLTPWWLIAALGMLFPFIFLCLAQSLVYAGMVKTEIAQRLSVVLSLLAAYFIFNESFSFIKLCGIGLGFVAVGCLLAAKQASAVTTHKNSIRFLILVWVGYALVDILLKYNSSLGQSFTLSLNLIFMVAFVLTALTQCIKPQTTWQFKNLPAGLLLGAFNFANIALYVQAHQQLKDSPALVFMLMNMSVVVFGAIAGMLIFKEKPNRLTYLGLFAGVLGVLSLAKAMT
ncbi:DMT family transporter [Acinetobacter sp. MD2(2019)]|uniref:DMT family transporter n=1 Tax=Acinetobacter sp. MD2(2019) TaxID=2605273 RepID=UPI002D1F680B|nr:DMT family transporter [Acinetobacter sp. MD2(2019)]MEB3752737.1 DMT family transporter [Acinetobacter sp. MD2(2019)]